MQTAKNTDVIRKFIPLVLPTFIGKVGHGLCLPSTDTVSECWFEPRLTANDSSDGPEIAPEERFTG